MTFISPAPHESLSSVLLRAEGVGASAADLNALLAPDRVVHPGDSFPLFNDGLELIGGSADIIRVFRQA